MSMYADDTRLFGQVKNEDDAKQMQEDLNRIYAWAEKNNMEFNSKKFELLRFGTVDEAKDSTIYKTSSGEIIQEKNSLRDLRITMSNDMRFDTHIEIMVAKANQMTGWILRSFKTRKPEAMMLLYKQLIRSNLEYCCPLWSPNDENLKQQIESIQRDFTRKIEGLSGENRPNYWERLALLNIYSLERRRERYNILYTVKALNGLVPNIGFTVKWNDRTGPKIEVPLVKKGSGIVTQKMKERRLMVQGPKLFNVLPLEVRRDFQNISIDSFKHKLDDFLHCIPDQPTVSGLSRAAPSNSLIDQISYKMIL